MPEQTRLETIEENQDAVEELASGARYELQLFSQDLESRLFNRPRFIQSLTKLATLSRRSRIQILVMDSGPAVRSGHRLIDLSRRLTSFIEIRRINPEYKEETRTFMLTDNRNFYYRPIFSSYKGLLETENPVGTQELQNFFLEVWESSPIDPEFRRLHI